MRRSAWLFALLLLTGGIWPRPVWAQLDTPFSLDTFRPYLARNYNTLLGWQGQPVTLSDGHLYLYRPRTQIARVQLEFIWDSRRIHTEIFKAFTPWSAFDYDLKQELNWFLVYATQSRVTPDDLQQAFQAFEKCRQSEFRIPYETRGAAYYLTVFANHQETFVRVSLTGTPRAPLVSQGCKAAGPTVAR